MTRRGTGPRASPHIAGRSIAWQLQQVDESHAGGCGTGFYVTGALFGISTVWWLYPLIDHRMDELRSAQQESQRQRSVEERGSNVVKEVRP